MDTQRVLVIWEDNSSWSQPGLDDDLRQASLEGLCQLFRFNDGEFQELAVTDPEEWTAVCTKDGQGKPRDNAEAV